MKKIEFLRLMKFPKEWLELGMYPDDLFEWQINGYEPGNEEGSEHDRNGAFHWWLKKSPSLVELKNLLYLASLDPDPFIANDVREYIKLSPSFCEDLIELEKNFFKSSRNDSSI